jgi:hypothetical protein
MTIDLPPSPLGGRALLALVLAIGLTAGCATLKGYQAKQYIKDCSDKREIGVGCVAPIGPR